MSDDYYHCGYHLECCFLKRLHLTVTPPTRQEDTWSLAQQAWGPSSKLLTIKNNYDLGFSCWNEKILPEKLEQLTFERCVKQSSRSSLLLMSCAGWEDWLLGWGAHCLDVSSVGVGGIMLLLSACLQRNVLLIQSTNHILSMRSNLSNSKHLLVAPI